MFWSSRVRHSSIASSFIYILFVVIYFPELQLKVPLSQSHWQMRFMVGWNVVTKLACMYSSNSYRIITCSDAPVRSKVLAMMSFCVALTSLASYHNWFGHFSWFWLVFLLLSVSLSCVESCAHACLLLSLSIMSLLSLFLSTCEQAVTQCGVTHQLKIWFCGKESTYMNRL